MENNKSGRSKRPTGPGQESAIGYGTKMSTRVVHTLKEKVIKDREAGVKEVVRACNTIALAERSVGRKQITPLGATHPHTTNKRRTSNMDRCG